MNSHAHQPPIGPTAFSPDNLPFDRSLLDALMAQAGLDVLIVTSKHNVQYLLGGYSFIFFSHKEAIGVSRYLPVIVYRRGHPEDTAYFGNALESFSAERGAFWPRHVATKSWGAEDAMTAAARHAAQIAPDSACIGVERSFLPLDAFAALARETGQSDFAESYFVLESLRRIKTPAELALLRAGSEAVVASMAATFRAARPGMTKADLVEHLRREETARGLTFEYCLVTAGTDHNRAATDQVLAAGDIISLDSGGNLQGWVGDLCRMGRLGAPDAELQDLLAAVDRIQMAARREIRPGASGAAIFAAAEAEVQASGHGPYADFLAHGMGLVSHEAPRLTASGPVPYPADDAAQTLEPGMVISVETALRHPMRGYIKLEDTVAVTEGGNIGFGDAARGWNVTEAGAEARA